MKMKSVFFAAALVAASSAFAQIFDGGDIYTVWFTTNSVPAVPFDTALNEPIFVNDGGATPGDGYVVTANVQIVIHAGMPDVPAAISVAGQSISPKGAICAVETDDSSPATNWYGLVGGEWSPLSGLDTPTEGEHSLVMEFKEKDAPQKVRYIIDGKVGSVSEVEWLESGHGDAPQSVAFSGTGKHSFVRGLTVTAQVSSSAVSYSWKDGFEFTNGTAKVTLEHVYDEATMGTVSLVVTAADGSEVAKKAATTSSPNIEVTPTLDAGQTYTYAIETIVNGVATTNVLGSFVSAASGSFGASVTNATVAAVFGGEWQGGVAPTTASSAYTIAGREVFNIDDSCGGLTIVDNAVTFTTWGDENDMVGFSDGTFAAITVVTNGASAQTWKAFAYTGESSYGWVDLDGGLTPSFDTEYDIRAIFDFGESKAVSYSIKEATSGEYIPFTYDNKAWIPIGDDKTALAEVGYVGIGKLNCLVGGNSDTNLAAIGGISYATLSDAMSAATNGNSVITLRTNTYWPTNLAAGTYTILTNGFVLAGISGSGITQTENGYTISLSTGVCVVDGGKLNLSAEALNSLITGGASGKTPAEISADLNEKQANGIEKWVNYVLGIAGNEASNKPFAAPVQNADQSKLTFKLGGVNVNDSVKEANVTYSVEELATPTAEPSDPPHAPDEDGNVTVDVPNGVKYYRVKVTITLQD